ncbi:hypothetical protein ACCD08_11570 [Telluria sp. Tellsp104]
MRLLATACVAALLAGCQHVAPALPGVADLKPEPLLPDPFRFADGQPVRSQADWQRRRTELAAQVQHYELGTKPGSAPVQARMDGANLVVTVTHEGRTFTFPAKIQLPEGGKAPYPAIIGMGAVSLNNDELRRMGVALITFPNNLVAEQKNGGSRGKGGFYDLYGSDHTAGAMAAWSWGVSRLIDALAQTPDARIDADRLGITGCSRNGKGAIVAGAFDDRIKLTLAQESGSGGAAGWRISDSQRAAGQNVQTLRQIVTENVWFTDSFKQFGEAAARLPFDQHEVMGLIAPRALLVVENTSMEWLGNESAWRTALAAREIWTALGHADAMGIAQVGGHPHCQLPVSQYGEVIAYARRFLLGEPNVDTRVLTTDGTFERGLKPWIKWDTPRLH